MRSHCHLLAIGKAVRMMRMIPMMPMALITLMMLMMLTMLVMLAMAPMLALGHGCCPHAGMAADGGGEPGEVDELPAACELEPELLLLLLLLALLGVDAELRSELVQFGALAMAGIAKVLQVMQRCAGRRPSDAGALPMRQDVPAGA